MSRAQLYGMQLWGRHRAHSRYRSWSDSTRFARGRKYHSACKSSQCWDSKSRTDFVPKLIRTWFVPRKEKIQDALELSLMTVCCALCGILRFYYWDNSMFVAKSWKNAQVCYNSSNTYRIMCPLSLLWQLNVNMHHLQPFEKCKFWKHLVQLRANGKFYTQAHLMCATSPSAWPPWLVPQHKPRQPLTKGLLLGSTVHT